MAEIVAIDLKADGCSSIKTIVFLRLGDKFCETDPEGKKAKDGNIVILQKIQFSKRPVSQLSQKGMAGNDHQFVF